MKRWALAMVLTSLLALGACDSGSDSDDKSDAKPGAAAPGGQSNPGEAPDPHYAVFPSKVPGTGWELTEATRQIGTGREVQLGGLPGVDWYAEFDGPPAEGGTNAYLSLTGYSQSLEERRAESVSDPSNVTEGDISGHKAFWILDPEDGAVVTWEITSDYTIEVFSTGISLGELLAMARSVKDASEAEWVAAGGQIADCKPGQDDCPDSADG
ncbi:hypothetical protein [Sporichthya sp.]|uniref:hypothetical protein n=1 Tax=Sporichthya sp. TaxID=65475 RepID=UPI00179588FD|nr:hypothetical protein [Sporichthya sp.]MBA3742702.1 hypothetical protein [Sporichthya sp.]